MQIHSDRRVSQTDRPAILRREDRHRQDLEQIALATGALPVDHRAVGLGALSDLGLYEDLPTT